MKYLFIAFLFISSFISGQGIEPTSFQPTPYKSGILKGVIPFVDEFTGDTMYIYQHVDSLVFIKDSIYVRNDSIFLRDGSGFAIVNDSIYVVTGATKDTIKLRDGDGFALVDKALVNGVRGFGVNPRIAYWGSTDSLSSDEFLYWDNTNKELVIRGIPYGSKATNQIYFGNGAATNVSNGAQSSFFMGTNAGYNAINAQQTVFLGVNAGYGATDANSSVFIGNSAGYNAYSAQNAIFISNLAGYGATNANNSIFQGIQSGYAATDAYRSTFMGYNAGFLATNAHNSIFQGYNAGYAASGARNAVFQGPSTGQNATNAAESVFIGNNVGINATNASNSVFIGNSAGYGAANSSTSIMIGLLAGGANLGGNNIIIGTDVTLPNSASNGLNIGSLIFGTGINSYTGTQNSTGKSGAKMGLLTNSPNRTLEVNGEVRIVDLNTDPPTKLIGADNDGDLGSVTVGNGLNIDAGTLTVTANINGTQNRVAKFTSQYAVGNSEIYTVGDTLVGINQPNPQYHLDVFGKFRVSQRTGTAATGAGFTADGQLIAYSLDTAEATPNTYLAAGTDINITGDGTSMNPYTINNSAPENTSVKNSIHIDFSELSNDTITGSIIAGSIGATEIASTSVAPGSYTLASITVDQDGRITSASSGSDGLGVTSITTTSPITGGTITSTGTIGINDAFANGSTKGASTFLASDFSDNGAGLISIDYTNGQAASGSTKGFLTSTDWTTFNNKQTTLVSGGNIKTVNGNSLLGGGNVSVGTVTAIGIINGGGLSVSGSPVTINGSITVTANDQSATNELQNLYLQNESAGSIFMDISSGSGIYYSEGTGINLVRTASNILTVNNTGDLSNTNELQTLSFSSPNLSISSGNFVTLPVLPSGSSNQTLRHDGSSWAATSGVTVTSGNRMDINSWPGTVNLGSKLLVNGHIQYTNTGFQASTITGRDTDGGLTGVTVGSGLSLSGGTLTATDASTSNEIQTLSHSAPTLSISSGNSITLTQQYGQMSSNGGCATVSTSYGTTVSGTAIGNNVTVSSTTITVPATGTYELNYSGYFILDPTASNVGVGMRVRKNGSSTVSVTIENIQGTASTEYRAMSKNVIVSLNSGDTLVLQPTKDAGTVNLCDYVMNIIRLN